VLPAPSAPASQKATLPPMGASGQLTSKVPSLRVPATPEILEPLSHPYRRIVRLVDGRRSIDEIARLLNKEPQEVQPMLAALGHLIQF
jgi:predicted transcriptional regulator